MKNCKKVVFYSYINSGNRGCEAILRSTYEILNLKENECIIFSDDVDGDTKLGIDEIAELVRIPYIHVGKFKPLSSIFPRVLRQFGIDKNALWKYKYKKNCKRFDNQTLAISTGGDIYCYGDSDWLTYLNKVAIDNGSKTVLWGCSIEERFLSPDIVADLKAYSLITVRESISKENLKKKGIIENVKYFPDPAFKLQMRKCDIFDWNTMGKLIGINLSIHIVKTPELYNAFKHFIQYLINETDFTVLLIPHVFWDSENDLMLLKQLYSELNNPSKIYLVDQEYSSNELKYIISRCTLYIGARTHSVIAAYSTCIPTLALSYSVKSRGIARDIFGSEDAYVLKVNNDFTFEKLSKKFREFYNNYETIKQKLTDVMPGYIGQLDGESEYIEALFSDIKKERKL